MTRGNGIHPFATEDPDAAPGARSGLPVVVIGAGPVGLAAATHLLDRGLEPLVLEADSQVGANIAQWRHVRLFSPWCLALDPVSGRLLDRAGWTGPGRLTDLQARAVIDASGTWTQPNPLGTSGLPALGQPDAAARSAGHRGCVGGPLGHPAAAGRQGQRRG